MKDCVISAAHLEINLQNSSIYHNLNISICYIREIRKYLNQEAAHALIITNEETFILERLGVDMYLTGFSSYALASLNYL